MKPQEGTLSFEPLLKDTRFKKPLASRRLFESQCSLVGFIRARIFWTYPLQ